MEQIIAKSQHHTPPKLQFNPRQQTPAIKRHNHQNTTTTPPQQQKKSKSQREISGSKVRSRGDEIELRQDRAAQCCGLRNARYDRCGAIGKIWCVRSSNWSSGFAGDVKGVIWASSPSSHVLSLCASDLEMVWSENLSFKPFLWSKPYFTRLTSNNF